MRRANLENSSETLHILVTRHPYEWIDSMQKNGFYAPFHKKQIPHPGVDVAGHEPCEYPAGGGLPSRQSTHDSQCQQLAQRRLGAQGKPSRLPGGQGALQRQAPVHRKSLPQRRGHARGEAARLAAGLAVLPIQPSRRVPGFHAGPQRAARIPGGHLRPQAQASDGQGRRLGRGHVPVALWRVPAGTRTDWRKGQLAAMNRMVLTVGGGLSALGTPLATLLRDENSELFKFMVIPRQSVTLPAQIDHSLQGKYMNSFNDETLRVTNAWLDPELESNFGYRIFDSMERAREPYTLQNRCSYHGTCAGE
eukprot:CAMPEP_0113727112 /NCGR_PEP_ID=MMETSP0038_2-20120614/40876_1 /TAXON_ID=2898 /ORGANISM="Cryptomonas paramecium" /LENGTH=306 /DNA_ID=CAMNT_0000657933 /DNA_START=675 /DNA_END=1596 /DNA_ORIENTATION=+ /assembly_acc=CAM_ASM_000170